MLDLNLIWNDLDRRTLEVYNKTCSSVRVSENKFLFFDQENGLPLVEYEVSIVSNGFGFSYSVEISEFSFANKLIG